jgi:2-polyprenyl-3-methyl-5-hydroxy-6-metoxy-1,4-benzoquinol methylase
MIASDYQGEKGKDYAIGRGQDRLNHLGDRLQASLFAPHLLKSDNVLDFGCGNASIAKALMNRVASIEGLEVNSYANDIAKSQGLTVYADLSEISFDKRYDVIISNHVFEHVVNVVETLGKLKLLLKPGGRLILILPLDDWREKNNREWFVSDPNHHLQTWTPLLIGNTMIEAGYQPQECKVLTHAWTYKLFFLGDGLIQHLACRLLSFIKKRRQIFAVGINS